MTLTTAITRSLHSLHIQPSTVASAAAPSSQFILDQIRTKMTKTKKRRILKKRKMEGQPKRHPPNYIPKDEPVIINPNAARESLAKPAEHERLSTLISNRSKRMQENEGGNAPPLRFRFTNIQDEMSPKVRQLFQLTNGSTAELAKARKTRAMELFQLRPGDTGSSAVQIMALTSRIQQLQNHVGLHRKDYSGKRGLDALYVQRRKLLDYLERKDFDTYRTVVKSLGLVR